MNDYLSRLETEQRNDESRDIDLCSTLEMVTLMNQQDEEVPKAVGTQLPQIAQAVDILYDALKMGGRLIYIGAGTSGRLGVLDASECPPTFGTPPELVQGFIAGGDTALRNAVEGSEDSEEQGRETMAAANVCHKDVVVGITASGSAPYVLAAVAEAKKRGAATLCIVTNSDTPLGALCDVCIAPVVGPEIITGSTRLKSGTAQKLVLNMLSTCTMIKLGKVYGNLMVDLNPSNIKLAARARRIVREVTGCDEQQAAEMLGKSGNNTKLAILMQMTGMDAGAAQALISQNGNMLRKALQTVGETV